MTAYRLYGVPIPEATVHAADDGTTVIDDHGQPITRWRTEQATRPRCAVCDHSPTTHEDGTGDCWQPPCGCPKYETSRSVA